jgi:hypothetical protein
MGMENPNKQSCVFVLFTIVFFELLQKNVGLKKIAAIFVRLPLLKSANELS